MIQIHNLSKIIDGHTMLELSCININPGEICAVVGPVYSGLDILINLLIGRETPSAGDVRVAGLSPAKDQKELEGKIGVLFRDDGLYSYLSAEKNLQFFARLYSIPKTRIFEILKIVGLADQSRTKVAQLPSGLARRLAFGRTILHHPSILILAYPFSRCDEDSIIRIKHLIRQEADQGGAILIMDEDPTNVEDLCSTIYILRQGRIERIINGSERQAPELPFKIPVKLEGKVILLNPSDILYAEASQGYTLLITKNAQLASQYTLQELEERLNRSGFFRAHRSFLVNLQHVQEVIPYSRNSYSLRLNNDERTEIPLSKNSAAELRDLLKY